MKTCTTCQRVYSDETMIFCLADGTELRNVTRNIDLDATWRLAPRAPEPAPTQMAPQTDGAEPLSTIQYHPELLRNPSESAASSKTQTSRSVLPWIFAMVVVLALSGVFIAWIVTRDRSEKNTSSQVPAATPQPSVSENANGTAPAQAQKTEGNKNSSKSTSPAPKTSSNSVNVPQISGLNPSPPPRKTTVKKEGSSTAVVKPEKKKVESPKPTGESFIPVQRPE